MKRFQIALCLMLALCLSLSTPCFAEKNTAELPERGNAYLFCREDGIPKYWLDFSGALSEDPVLHCYFRSGDPEFYEVLFFLELETSDAGNGKCAVRCVTDQYGADRTNWFRKFLICPEGDGLSMTVVRDPGTLAGGSEDNILDGIYLMHPVNTSVVYEYRGEDGQLKYRLIPRGEIIELHALFRSGDPAYYEEVFLLETEPDDNPVHAIERVTRISGEDVSHWFRSLTLSSVQGAYLLNVQRDESTLAGGADDNLLSGVYCFEPQIGIRPVSEGPYTTEELGRWAQIFYFQSSGFFPPIADVEENADGSITIHLYEIVSLDGDTHTATSAWYTVDAYGCGRDDITGETVSFFS